MQYYTATAIFIGQTEPSQFYQNRPALGQEIQIIER